MRYRGKVDSSLPRHNLGFILLSSVTKEDGSPASLTTEADIFIHQDNCSGPLLPGAEMLFEVEHDDRRGADALRAINAVMQSCELMLVGADGRELAIADPKSLYVPPTQRQSLTKFVPAEDVEAVIKNEPMPLVPRDTQAGQTITKDDILSRVFPQLYTLSQETGADFVDESFDAVLADSVANHRSLGLNQQADYMIQQAGVFKGLRTILNDAEDLLTPGSILPIQYLPDLFMAVPVWYFWADESLQHDATEIRNSSDPRVHENLKYFCKQFPNQRWADTFLMFNRRMRTLADYRGDIIPPRIISRMRSMAPHFDYLTIMTPYHDVAGQDWSNLEWLRSIDPYVVGFIKGVPMMFVLGRFSDSGVFPLHSELVADTLAFLRKNIDKLSGFDAIDRPYWVLVDQSNGIFEGRIGAKLKQTTKQLIAAFEQGYLFDWLRGADQKLPTAT